MYLQTSLSERNVRTPVFTEVTVDYPLLITGLLLFLANPTSKESIKWPDMGLARSQVTKIEYLILCLVPQLWRAGLSTLSESTGGCRKWRQVSANPTCCPYLFPRTSHPTPKGTAAMIIHRTCSAGIWEWKVLPVCWICYSHGAMQEIILPKITHSSPEHSPW